MQKKIKYANKNCQKNLCHKTNKKDSNLNWWIFCTNWIIWLFISKVEVKVLLGLNKCST